MYNSAIFVRRPAVKQENGDFVCVTTSTKTFTGLGGAFCVTEIPNVNPYVQDYWSKADTDGGSPTTQHDAVTTVTSYARRTDLKVVLGRPFVYQPDWGTVSIDKYPARVVTEPGLRGPNLYERPSGDFNRADKNTSDYGHEDYGYIPQALVDYLSRDSDLSSQIFQSISLFPGGPKLDPSNPCEADARLPFFAKAAPDIHDSSEETINVAGCFHPGACPGASGQTAAVTTPAAEHIPQSASAPAQIKLPSPAIQTQAANIQGGLITPVKISRSSDVGTVQATPQVFPVQSSPTQQSNGGTPGQQLPPQPNNTPIATAQKLNGPTPNQTSLSQPDLYPAPSVQPSHKSTPNQNSPLLSNSNQEAPTQNFNGAISDLRVSPHPDSNSALSSQGTNRGMQDQIVSLQSSSNFITIGQTFNEATSDQMFSSQPNTNSASLTQKSNHDTQSHIFPSHSSFNSIVSAQNFQTATSDQEFPSQSNTNPSSPAQNSNDDTQGLAFSSQSTSDFTASEQIVNETAFDQQLSSLPDSDPISPLAISSGDTQGQTFRPQ